jgi:hypothetical protein
MDMRPSKRTLRITKIQGATRQTNAAIEAFARGDFDITITLAGAAEGMIKREGSHAFAFLRDSPRVQHVLPKAWINTLNLDRDWLKHPSGPDVLRVKREAAAMMIARAASKLWSPQMKEFKRWLMENLNDL